MTITLSTIRSIALELGFDDVGVTTASIPEADIAAYRKWIIEGGHGDLEWMTKEIRCFPREFFPGAKHAIIFVSNYQSSPVEPIAGQGIIAAYARGKDYHNVHRHRLKRFIRWLEVQSGLIDIAKPFSDSSPVLEKALAVQAGLGWFGKNTLLIHRRFGTMTLLAGVMTSLSIEGGVEKDERMLRCGTCTKCLDACPTGALSPYRLETAKCLSFHLIEAEGDIPAEIRKKNPGYAFGCDICQNVCPHNMRKPVANSADFGPEAGFGAYLTLEGLEAIENDPTSLYGTPLKRRGAKGLRLNLKALKDYGA